MPWKTAERVVRSERYNCLLSLPLWAFWNKKRHFSTCPHDTNNCVLRDSWNVFSPRKQWLPWRKSYRDVTLYVKTNVQLSWVTHLYTRRGECARAAYFRFSLCSPLPYNLIWTLLNCVLEFCQRRDCILQGHRSSCVCFPTLPRP